VQVIYSPKMLAPAQGFSPSAAKPAVVVEAWLLAFPELPLRAPAPATREALARAHDSDYVEAVYAMREPNGFGTFSAEVNDSLAYTSGALLDAARAALASGGAAAAPCSGFHHAGWDFGGAFCTFNGLMVAALALQAERPGVRVGILDYDYHHGDGTEHIIERLKPGGVVHITAGAVWHRAHQAEAFLANIASDLEQLSGCDVVLYQAGADPHIDDPLGGFLTTSQMAMRDWKVFQGLKERGIAVAWNLAGGYQSPLSKVVQLHLNTMRACLEAFELSEAMGAARRIG